jgi:hypothetical protein
MINSGFALKMAQRHAQDHVVFGNNLSIAERNKTVAHGQSQYGPFCRKITRVT